MPRPKSYQENVRNFTNAILAAAPDAQLVPKPKPKRKRRRQKPEATEPAHESRPRAGTCKKTCHVKCDGLRSVPGEDWYCVDCREPQCGPSCICRTKKRRA